MVKGGAETSSAAFKAKSRLDGRASELQPSSASPNKRATRSTRSKSTTSPNTGTASKSVNGVGVKRVRVEGEESESNHLPTTTSGAASLNSPWQSMLQEAIPSIVSVRYSLPVTFDTESAGSGEATGFIVDAEKGLLLTNRHVVSCAPFVGEALFHDHEQLPVYPIYRDPVHDFGFLRFDPKRIKYMPVKAIPLVPEAAKVGLEIRVVGNDAGEKLSILSGSIGRVDRNAPDYGEFSFNDFNTFYFQAASSTSGGSSGSPVLNIHGEAVALQAGGATKAATDFFLPLQAVSRALGLLQAGRPVSRGTIQVQWLHRPYDEVIRLGISSDTEQKVRRAFPLEIGMLVAEMVLPEGPASAFLEAGDVLVSVNGNLLTTYYAVEAILDESVGKSIQVEVERGGVLMSFDILVQDLHSITPDEYVSVGGANLNTLSYQLARYFCLPTKGVYLPQTSGMMKLDGMDGGVIITTVNSHPVPDMKTFISVMQSIPDREMIPIEFYSIADVHSTSVSICTMDKHWSSFKSAKRNDLTGYWDFTDLMMPSPSLQILPKTISLPTFKHPLFQSLVKVDSYFPAKIEGFHKSRCAGGGVIIDADLGLIVVGRIMAPHSLGDFTCTFSESSVILPARIAFLHPTLNFAILRYDPKLLGSTAIKAATLDPRAIEIGQAVTLVALNHNRRPVSVNTSVTDISAVSIPQTSSPRYKAINFDAISLDTPLTNTCSSGALVVGENVCGLWLSFLGDQNAKGADNNYALGLPVHPIIDVLSLLRQGAVPILRGLAIEVRPVQMAMARNLGLSDAWVTKVEQATDDRRQLFLVQRVEASKAATGNIDDGAVDVMHTDFSPDSLSSAVNAAITENNTSALKDSDLILSVNGRVITRIHELGVSPSWPETVEVVVLRSKQIRQLSVPIVNMEGECVKQIVFWAGAVIHEPHRAVRQQSRTLPRGIYVASHAQGSPAAQYGLSPTCWIIAINERPTPSIEAFVSVIKGLADDEYVRIKTITFDGVPWVVSMKLCYHYWPTSMMIRKDIDRHEGTDKVERDEDLTPYYCGWKSVSLL